jgi:hypothetical protein
LPILKNVSRNLKLEVLEPLRLYKVRPDLKGLKDLLARRVPKEIKVILVKWRMLLYLQI